MEPKNVAGHARPVSGAMCHAPSCQRQGTPSAPQSPSSSRSRASGEGEKAHGNCGSCAVVARQKAYRCQSVQALRRCRWLSSLSTPRSAGSVARCAISARLITLRRRRYHCTVSMDSALDARYRGGKRNTIALTRSERALGETRCPADGGDLGEIRQRRGPHDAVAERGNLGREPLVLFAGAQQRAAASAPLLGEPEVIEHHGATIAEGLEALLLQTAVAARGVAECADGSVGELERDQCLVAGYAAVVPRDGNRTHRRDQRAGNELHEIQEMTALADQPAAADRRVLNPVSRVDRARIHPGAHDQWIAAAAEKVADRDRVRREAPIEAHHDALTAGEAAFAGFQHPGKFRFGEAQRLLNKHMLAGIECLRNQLRVAVMARPDQYRVDLCIGQDRLWL